jgi:hypothetical protein
MIYEAYFSEDELEFLKGLKGAELRRVTSDGWAYFLTSEIGTYAITVVEEATPDDSHQAGDVSRPQIAIGEEPAHPKTSELKNPIRVEKVSLLRTLVTMSPPEQVEKGVLRGLPAHTAYGPLFTHPEDERLPQLRAQAESGSSLALTFLDIGFRIDSPNHEGLSLHTDGASFFTELSWGNDLARIPSGVVLEVPL